MTLSFNPKTNAFILTSNDEERAKAVGLTLSTRIRGAKGEKVWYTADKAGTPTFNPYAALPFWDVANGDARNRLDSMYKDYSASWADSCDLDFPAPKGKEYMPYQKAGISYALDHHNCLVGDEPGLGKTIQAIGIANAVEAQRVLVICPASIRLNWQREIREWSTLKRVSTYPILKSGDGVNPYSNFVIISYDLASRDSLYAALHDIEWDLMILDEGHYLKSLEAKRTRAIFGGGRGLFQKSNLAEKAKRIVALTGTPLPNRPRECYTLARAMCWESIDWASYDDFTYRYNPSGRVSSGFNLEKKGRLPELQARLRSNFMVRRLKKDVLKDLPDKRYEFTYIEPNKGVRSVLAKEKFIDFDPGILMNPDFKLDGAVATVRREMGEAMVPLVVDHVKFLLDIVEIPKIVMFAHHRSVMDAIIEALHSYGLVISRGGMGNDRKQQSVDLFGSDPNIRLFFGQLDTMEGVDGLQNVADHCVFAEPAWTPGRNEQCVDRLHRHGQHGNVVAQFLLAEGSFNEKVLGSVLEKAQDIFGTLDSIRI